MISRGIVLFLLLSCSLVGQEFRALVQGTITDPTGAVIPRAEVTLRNLKTGAARSMIADRTGRYVFQLLPPGDYSVTAMAAGFRTTTRENIAVQTNERASVDLSLPLGPSFSTVVVSGDVTMLQPNSSTLGSVVRMGA